MPPTLFFYKALFHGPTFYMSIIHFSVSNDVACVFARYLHFIFSLELHFFRPLQMIVSTVRMLKFVHRGITVTVQIGIILIYDLVTASKRNRWNEKQCKSRSDCSMEQSVLCLHCSIESVCRAFTDWSEPLLLAVRKHSILAYDMN